jgi:seryl-tRNA(Sec) selenium transferase
VGKEELVGLMTAVKWYLGLDHEALMASYEDQVQYAIDAFSACRGISARRDFPSEAGQPMPRADIVFDETALGLTRDEILSRLRTGTPSIALAAAGTSGVYLNPQTLQPGEVETIVASLKQIICAPPS